MGAKQNYTFILKALFSSVSVEINVAPYSAQLPLFDFNGVQNREFIQRTQLNCSIIVTSLNKIIEYHFQNNKHNTLYSGYC